MHRVQIYQNYKLFEMKKIVGVAASSYVLSVRLNVTVSFCSTSILQNLPIFVDRPKEKIKYKFNAVFDSHIEWIWLGSPTEILIGNRWKCGIPLNWFSSEKFRMISMSVWLHKSSTYLIWCFLNFRLPETSHFFLFTLVSNCLWFPLGS